MKKKQLHTEIRVLEKQQEAIVSKAKDEKRSMSTEELATFDKIEEDLKPKYREFEALNKRFMPDPLENEDADDDDADEKRSAASRRQLPVTIVATPDGGEGDDDDDEAIEKKRNAAEVKAEALYSRAFFQMMRSGIQFMNPDQMKHLHKRATNVTDSTGALGAYAVPREFSRELEKRMKYFGGIEALRFMPTRRGGTLDYPTIDDTSNSSAWGAQATALSETALTLGQVTFSAYTLRTLVLLSLEALQDEDVNLVSELSELLGDRHGRALQTAVTNGDGSGKPTGFLPNLTGVNAAGTTILRPDIINLIHGVDPSYRQGPKVGFQLHDTILAAIKKITFGSADDRPMYVPSPNQDIPSTIEGYRFWINNDMTATTTSTSRSMAFGDWSKYVVRQVQTGQLARLNELYMGNLSVGFLYWGRYDGKILQSQALRALVHP